MADALKVKSPAIRIHAIGLDAKAEELKPLACATAATGGEFVAATEASTFKQGLATVLDAIASPGAHCSIRRHRDHHCSGRNGRGINRWHTR